ncbi:MAG: hypothetical protein ACW967_09870, partial [Candidatus Hodarchaeales archaeon]
EAFDIDETINITIYINRPTKGKETFYRIENIVVDSYYSAWHESFPYTSLEGGYHDLEVEVTNGSEIWYGSIGWHVGEDLVVLIEQEDRYVLPGEEKETKFSLESHFGEDKNYQVKITFSTPSVDNTILFEETINIPALGLWEKTISYTFDEIGRYEYEFLITDDFGGYWDLDTWWRVRDENDSSDSSTPDNIITTTPGFGIIMLFSSLVFVISYIRYQKNRRNN